MAHFIEADQFTKTFPTALGLVPWVQNFGRMERRTVLDRVSFSARQGELLGLLGINGAGRSTILRILAGLIVPDRGTVRVGGIDALTAMPAGVLFPISLLPLRLQGVSWLLAIAHAPSGVARAKFAGTLGQY